MKKLSAIALVILFVTSTNAQVTQEWVQTYAGGSLAPWNKGIALDNSGNVYIAGGYFNGSVTSMLLQKYDAAGNLVWTQNYLPAGSTKATALALAVDGNGDVIVNGTISNNIGYTRKYDPNGQLLWSQSTTFSNFSMVIDETNNIYVTSWDMAGGGGLPMKTIKYSAAGNLLWTASGSSSVLGNAHGKIFYKGGFLYRTGDNSVKINGKNVPVMYTIKYNASTGAQVWAKSYYHADKISQAGWDLVVDAGGNVYVTGVVTIKAGNNQNMNWVTLKYNSAGTQQWAMFYDGNGNDNIANGFVDSPNGMTMDNGGNIIVTGFSYTTTGQSSSYDMTTIKYSSAGSQVWVKTYDSPSHGNDNALAIISDASSNVYITGDTTTIKYNSSGIVQWTANYSGGGTMRNLCIDNSGNVYVGGRNSAVSILIKYSQGIPPPITNKQIYPAEEIINLNALKLYPNPAINQITIRNANNKSLGAIRIFDVSGKMVYQKFVGSSQTMIDVRQFRSGVYYLRSDQFAMSIKFVKN